jgi:hypothetical protein
VPHRAEDKRFSHKQDKQGIHVSLLPITQVLMEDTGASPNEMSSVRAVITP